MSVLSSDINGGGHDQRSIVAHNEWCFCHNFANALYHGDCTSTVKFNENNQELPSVIFEDQVRRPDTILNTLYYLLEGNIILQDHQSGYITGPSSGLLILVRQSLIVPAPDYGHMAG